MPHSAESALARHTETVGLAYGLAAFLLWGIAPLYFHLMGAVPPVEILAHRITWSFVLIVCVLLAVGQWRAACAGLTLRRVALSMLTAGLVTINWGVFIWAVTNGRTLETSVGYYVNPLVIVLLGVVILREKLRPAQWVSVALAALGVGTMVISFGGLPWVSLTLATSWGVYALVRKVAKFDALGGFFMETLVLLPFALGWLIWLSVTGTGNFVQHGDRLLDLMLMFMGPVTAVPLLLFVQSALRLRLATIGVLQYIAPTISFLLAVLVFGETFTTTHAITFGFIWAGVVLFAWDGWRAGNSARNAFRLAASSPAGAPCPQTKA
jgi:chloramphenicol-sensitive protein RarD